MLHDTLGSAEEAIRSSAGKSRTARQSGAPFLLEETDGQVPVFRFLATVFLRGFGFFPT